MPKTLQTPDAENLLVVLCFHKTLALELAERLTLDMFGPPNPRGLYTIAERVLKYIAQHKQPPGTHLSDLFAAELRNSNVSDPNVDGKQRYLAHVIDEIFRLQNDVSEEYVRQRVDNFIWDSNLGKLVWGAVADADKGDRGAAFSKICELAKRAPPGSRSTEEISDPWDDPKPPDFPLHALPDPLQAFVENRARVIGADPAAIAMPALAACGAVIHGGCRLQMKAHDKSFQVPPNLWVALIGAVSAKKTPAINASWRHVHALQASERERKNDVWKAKGSQGEPPVPRRFVSSGATMEGLRDVLVTQDTGLGIQVDELTGWIGGLERYAGGKAAWTERAFWLEAYDGGSYIYDRAKRSNNSGHVSQLLVSIVGGIQTDKIKVLGELMDDGLFQRFIPVLIRGATSGADDIEGPAFHDCLQQLIWDSYADTYKLDFQAYDLTREFERKMREYQKTGALGPKFEAFCGKADGMLGRLMLILSHLESGDGVVDRRTAERACVLMDYVLKNAALVYTMINGASADGIAAKAIAGFILAHNKLRITHSDLTRNVQLCRNRSHDEIRKLVAPLIAGNWLTPEGIEREAHAWRVDPAVHAKFAERAEQERQRCARERELIADAVEQRRDDERVFKDKASANRNSARQEAD